ncbi:MAG: transcription antitermination factor NusB [Coriobacteriales bacterium]
MSNTFEGRTRARSQAIQLLFQADFQQKDVYDLLADGSYVLDDGDAGDGSSPAMEYAEELARGVARRQVAIDRLISSVSVNWNLPRMPLVDREIMSVAIYEMFDEEDIPVAVAVSEAVEIAKVYGTDNSSSFINGILGRIARLAQAHPDVPAWKLCEYADESPEETRAALRAVEELKAQEAARQAEIAEVQAGEDLAPQEQDAPETSDPDVTPGVEATAGEPVEDVDAHAGANAASDGGSEA